MVGVAGPKYGAFLVRARGLWLWLHVDRSQWVYDLCKHTPDSELEARMKGVVEVPRRHENI